MCAVSWLVFPMPADAATGAGTLTVASTTNSTNSATTPVLLGYNLGHFTTNGNAPDWFRYSGVNAARVFMSPSVFSSSATTSSPGKSSATNQASFNTTVAAARAAGTNSSSYISWSSFVYNVTDNGNNAINYDYAYRTLGARSVETIVNITCSTGTFTLGTNIVSSTDFQNEWSIWQHYYAQAYLLSRDYGIHRFAMYNEPNGDANITSVAQWLLRLRICSDAIQAGVADANAASGKSLVPLVYAPNTANGAEKYNTSPETWGHDAVAARHLKLDGSTDTNSWLFNFYNYQKYTSRLYATNSLSGFITDAANLASYIKADMPGETPFPLVLTEFNMSTAADFDADLVTTLDTPLNYAALGGDTVGLTQKALNQLFLFKFGQTASSGSNTNFAVTKNGTHYVDNTSSAHNYGGATKAAEVYRLFNKAAQGSRVSYNISTTSDLSPGSSTNGVWSLATKDVATGIGYVFMVNKNTNAEAVSLDLSSWSVPSGNPLTVEEVSTTSAGGIVSVSTVQSGVFSAGILPAQAVWLVSFPLQAAGVRVSQASDDVQLYDGTGQQMLNNKGSSMSIRSDGTTNGRTVALVKIPTGTVADLKDVLLDLNISGVSNTTIQSHVYGIKDTSWSGGTATWKSMSNVLSSATKNGNKISNNAVLNQGTNPVAVMLGEIISTNSSPAEIYLDVAEFVKSQTNGYASFLVVQDYRWDSPTVPVTNSSYNTGDTQSGGLGVASRNFSGAAARLLSITTNASSLPPVILKRPINQNLNAGGSCTLGISTLGGGTKTYQWKKDGVAISGATNPSLSLSAVSSNSIGYYAVDVSNTAGTTTSSSALVTINGTPGVPVITTSPQNLVVEQGASATFSVTASGASPMAYQWSFNSVPVSGATNASYSFIASNANSAGIYSVDVGNAYGSTTASVLLSVVTPSTNYFSLTNTTQSPTNNFTTALERSSVYSASSTNYSAWPPTNATYASAMTNWYMESDLSPLANSTVFEGYRAFNYTAATETNHFNGQNLTLADSGVFSIGSASGISTRSLGGIPFTNNAIYLALRIRNSTTNVLDQCTIKYSFNQNTSSGFTNSTWMTLSTATGFLNSLKQGSWTDRLTNIPTTAGIASYQILASPTSVSTNLILTNLSILPGQDLWIRWTISTTSPNQPLLLAIDNVGVTNFVTKSQNIITFSPLTSTATYGDASLPLNASASSGLPVSFVSSDTNVVSISGTNLILNSAGTAVITASQQGDSSYVAATPVSQSLTVYPGTPVITISNTNQPYNGSPRSVSTGSVPSGLSVGVTYDGSGIPPSLVGNYALIASNTASTTWVSSVATGTLTIYDPTDKWRQSHYGTSANSGSAADSAITASGLNNLQAYTFGIDPGSPSTTPLLSLSNRVSNNGITLSFLAMQAGSGQGYSGLSRYYNLEGTTNLTNSSWTPLEGYSAILGTNQTMTFTTNASGGVKWFYRLKAWLQ